MNLRRTLHRLLSPLIYNDGTAMVPAAVAPEWPQRRFLRRLLRELDADCVLDVGANAGQYAQILRLIGFRGIICSFEPSPAPYSELQRVSWSDKKWHIFNCALGVEAGTAQLNLMSSSVFNSFRAPSTQETAYAEGYNQVVDKVDVEVERLDALLPNLRERYGFERPFLKTDTQGFDLEVFRGAAGVHSELAGVQCELAVKRLYEDVTPWTEALDEYLAAGFELAGIFNVLPRELTLIECDCFFRRVE